MKRSKKKNYAIIVLIVLLIAIAVGYAAFQTVLTINGTVTSTSDWDVKFTDAKLIDSTGSTANSEAYGSVTFTDDVVTATGIKLGFPGDSVKLRVVITNEGNLDAKLTSVVVNDAALANTDLSITPTAVGSAGLPTANEILAAGDSCTCEFVIKWADASKKDSTTGNFTVTFTYDQDAQAITLTPAHSHSSANP